MWFPYFFLTFDDSILILCSSNITCDSSFLMLGGSLTFFSHLTVPSSYCVIPILHLTILLSHIVVPLFLFFSQIWWFHCYIKQYQHRIYSIFVTCDSSFVICDSFFYHIWWFPYFFLTFDNSNLTLCNSNITYDSSFLTFDGPLLFFLTFDGFILTICSFKITCECFFLTFGGSLTFFLTYDGSIVLLSSTNIASNSIFVTFRFFYYYIGQYPHYFWSYFCHIWWYPIFFLIIDSSIVTIIEVFLIFVSNELI